MVILGAQLDVQRYYDCFADGDGEKKRDYAQEAEDVVVRGFVEVDGFEDEEEFDEEDGEGDEAC